MKFYIRCRTIPQTKELYRHLRANMPGDRLAIAGPSDHCDGIRTKTVSVYKSPVDPFNSFVCFNTRVPSHVIDWSPHNILTPEHFMERIA